MRRPIQYSLMAIFAAVLLVACSSGDSTEGTWELTAMADATGQLVAPLPDTTITLTVEDGTLSGNSGCNGYSGEGDLEDFSGEFATTMMACPDPVMEQERTYIATLVEVASTSVDGSSMDASNSAGAVTLQYIRIDS